MFNPAFFLMGSNMAKAESWLKRNIVAIVSTTIAATIAALGVAVSWYNDNKPTPN